MLQFQFLCLLIVTSCFAKQSFDEEPRDIEANPGQDVILPCRIFDKSRNSICSWQKDGFPISLQTGKYQWDGDRQRGDCSLKVYKADINFDNGRPTKLLSLCIFALFIFGYVHIAKRKQTGCP